MAGKFWVVIRRQGNKRKATADYGLTYDREKAQIVQLKSSADLDKLQKQVMKDLKIPSDWDALLFDTESLGGESNKLKVVTDTAFKKMTDIFNYYHDPKEGDFYTGEFAIRATFYNGGTRSDSSLDFSFLSPKISSKKPRKKKDEYLEFDFRQAKGTNYDGRKLYMKRSDYDLEMKKYRAKMRMLVNQCRGLIEASRTNQKKYHDEIYEKQWFVRWCSEKASGAKFPGYDIWNYAETDVNEAERVMNVGHHDWVPKYLEMFEADYNKADKIWYGYRNKTQKSAGNIVVGLKITKDVSFLILKLTLAPAAAGAAGAAGAGLVVKTLAEAGVEMAIEGVKESVSRVAEMKNKLRKEFNAGDFVKKMVIEFGSVFVGNLGGNLRGAFTEQLRSELVNSLVKQGILKNSAVRYLESKTMDKILEATESEALEQAVKLVASKFDKKNGVSMDVFLRSVCREYVTGQASLVGSIADKIATVEAQ